jgi:Flp pilus assembly protein TadD
MRRDAAVYLALLILTCAAYWTVTGHDFIEYDDPLYVFQNPHVQSGLTVENVGWAFTSTECSNWHPLTWLSLMFDCQIFGANPHAFHAVNLVFHVGNSLLLLFVLQQLTGAFWRSAFVAAFFALHPLHVESVAWVAERKDVLSTFFELLTVLAYIGYTRKRSASRYLLVLVLFVFGLMAKPMLVTLPVILLLLDFWPLNRFAIQRRGTPTEKKQAGVSTGSLIAEKMPLLILALASSMVTIWAQHPVEVVPVSTRAANAALAYLRYMGKMFWPAHLAILYPYHPVPLSEALLAGAALVAITGFAIAKARVLPYIFVGWFWFLIMLLPVIGLVQVGEQALADRYSYVPLIGLFVILVWGSTELVDHFKWSRSVLAASGVGLIVVCALTTHHQLSYWENGTSLFGHALEVTSNNYVAENGMANSLLDAGKLEEANQHIQKGLQIKPTIALYTTLVNVNIKARDPSGVVQAYWKALQFKPDAPKLLNNLAWILATNPDDKIRDGAKAVELAEKACNLTRYRQPAFIGTLAAAYAEAGRFPDAISAAQQACDIAAAGGMTAVQNKNRELLDLYRASRAYRDPEL